MYAIGASLGNSDVIIFNINWSKHRHRVGRYKTIGFQPIPAPIADRFHCQEEDLMTQSSHTSS